MIYEHIRAHMYIEELPEINNTSYFLVKKDAYTTLVEDWLEYIDIVVVNLGRSQTTNKKNYFTKFKKQYKRGSYNFFAATEKVKESLGIGGEFEVLKEHFSDNSIKYTPVMNYDELTKLFYSKDKLPKSHLVRQQIIDRFFLIQWNKGRLQYPIYLPRSVISRTKGFEYFLDDVELLDRFKKWLEDKNFKDITTKNLLYATLIGVVISTNWKKLSDITEIGLNECETLVFKKELESNSKGKLFLYMLNELRRMLIYYGREDINSPIETKTKKLIASGKKAIPFGFVDIQLYPNLEELVNKSRTFLNVLEADGLSKGTITSKKLHLNHFFRYLMKYYKHTPITIKSIDKLFDPDNSNSFREYLIKLELSSSSNIFSSMASLLVYCELLSAYARNHIPKFKKKVKLPYRKAIPVKMLRHLKEIVIDRPPTSVIYWDNGKVDTSWWKHKDVYPVFPLMFLLNFFIPIRGGQVRHICRENSFIFNEQGGIDAFVINTDKNTSRTELQQVPNVWPELNIFEDFLKWHKKAFPNILKIKYENDDNTPWEDLYPLFILPNRFKPMSQRTHSAYFKKLLCIYQIEANNQLIAEGIEPNIKVVWRSDDKPIFTDLEEAKASTLTVFDRHYKAEYDLHSLRVTGITRYLEAGLNFKMVMMLSGHKTPHMVLDTYNRLNYSERQNILSTAYKKIFLGVGKDTVKNSKKFVMDEMSEIYDNDEISLNDGFEANGLFSLARKGIATSNNMNNSELGTQIANQSHPSTWFPMIHGICPGVQCPDGREKKCSLCPYLITGRVFLDGVTQHANLAFMTFYRLTNEVNEEQQNGNYENKPKTQKLEMSMEEIMGWNEILQKINDEIEFKDSDNKDNLPSTQNTSSISKVTQADASIIYLETNYRAKMMGVEYDKEGLSLLTIKAFNLAKNLKDNSIYQIASDGDKVIDYLMKHYTKYQRVGKVDNFLELLDGVLPKSNQLNYKGDGSREVGLFG